MNKFIAIIVTKKEFSPETYPSLFDHFSKHPGGIHFASGVVAFPHDGDLTSAFRSFSSHLTAEDNLVVFQLHSGLAQLSTPERQAQLEIFLTQ